MARKFDVIEVDGRTRGPQVRKSLALLMIRRLVAIQIAPFVIKRLEIRQIPSHLPRQPLQPRKYIPDTLPPMETGGCTMKSPESVEWQKIHAAPSHSLRKRAHLMRMVLGYGNRGRRVVFAE